MFDVYKRQTSHRSSATAVREHITAVVGGEYTDLICAKTIDTRGAESFPTARNPNVGHNTSRYAPTSARVGFRLTV